MRLGEEALLLPGLAVSRLCWAHSWTVLTLKEVTGTDVSLLTPPHSSEERSAHATAP